VTIERGTTFRTANRRLISGNKLNGAPIERVAAVPFQFVGNALLVGIDPKTR
jgi:hypothetical protein